MDTKKETPRPHSARGWVWTLTITTSIYATCPIDRLAGGDSGELLAEACVGGNAHPPGYPLLLLVLRAVRLLGSYVCPHVRFVVLANAVNVALAAGAASCVAHTVELLAGHAHLLESVAAGLLFACSALAWEYALGLEVFALNNLLVGLLLVCFVEHYVRRQSMGPLYVGAFICGLGLANQHTIVLFEIPMILWVITTTKLRMLNWMYLTVAFISGLSPYAYTFSAAQTPTQGSWGDASTLQGLWTHVLRREYGTFQLSPKRGPSESLMVRVAFYAEDVVDQFTPLGSLCAMLGLLSSLWQLCRGFCKPSPVDLVRDRLIVALSLILAGYVVVFNSLANLPLHDPLTREVTRRFFLQPNVLVALMAGMGMVSLRQLPVASSAAAKISRALVITVVAHQTYRSHTLFTVSTVASHDLLRDFGSTILQDLPVNAMLLSYTDVQWNTVRYLQKCENKRPDVVHLNLQIMAFPWFERQHRLYPQVSFPRALPDISTNRSSRGYAAYLSRFVSANLHGHQIFLDLHGVSEDTIANEQLLFGQIQVLPQRLVWELVQPSTNSEQLVEKWRTYASRQLSMPRKSLLMDCCGIPSHTTPLAIPRGSWEYVVVSIAHDAMYQYSLATLGYWLAHGSILSVEQLQQSILAFDAIEHELNDLVWAGIQFSSGAITYDMYAVEKNAVVSRQRFQLYLEVLADLIHQGHDVQIVDTRVQVLLSERKIRREKAITQVEAFLVTMRKQLDVDADALQHGLETIRSKNTEADLTLHAKRLQNDKPRKKKKHRKQKP